MNLLLTKIPDEKLEEACAREQIVLESIPFIKTDAIVSYELSKLISAAAMEDVHVAFTSSNAVESIATYLHGLQPEWKIYCTSPATQKTVERILPSSSILATAENAEELARKMVTSGISKWLFICGEQRRPELPDLLKAANISVEQIVVYRTVATPVALSKEYDAIVFYSPSAVTSFFSVNEIPVHTALFCIGKTTAVSIDKKISNPVIISHDPSQETLIQTIIQYFRINPVATKKVPKLK